MTLKGALLFLWLVASLLALFSNYTFWIGLWSFCACVLVGRKYYEDGGNDSKGVC